MLAKQGVKLVFFKMIVHAKIIQTFFSINIFLGYVKRTLCEFQTFLLPKHATFFYALSQTFFYLAVFEMLMYGLDM